MTNDLPLKCVIYDLPHWTFPFRLRGCLNKCCILLSAGPAQCQSHGCSGLLLQTPQTHGSSSSTSVQSTYSINHDNLSWTGINQAPDAKALLDHHGWRRNLSSSNRFVTIRIAHIVVILGGKALNTITWVTSYHPINTTVPIWASAGNKENKYDKNYSIAGMPLHFRVNHCGPAANAEDQLFCSLRHQLSPKGMATGNTEIEFSFIVLWNNRREWWMTNDCFPMDQLGEGGFLLCALLNWAGFNQASKSVLHEIQHQNWTRTQIFWLHLVKTHYSIRATNNAEGEIQAGTKTEPIN